MLTVVVLIQAGVITGENVRKVFDYAKEHKVRPMGTEARTRADIRPPVCHPRKLPRVVALDSY